MNGPTYFSFALCDPTPSIWDKSLVIVLMQIKQQTKNKAADIDRINVYYCIAKNEASKRNINKE